MTLLALILRAMTILAASEPAHVPVNEGLARDIAAAVEGEPDAERWAARMVVYAWQESRLGWRWDGRKLVFDACRSGDGGKAHGYWQIHARPELACASADAARLWLRMAKASVHDCGGFAELMSGSCNRGTRVAAWRERETDRVMREVGR